MIGILFKTGRENRRVIPGGADIGSRFAAARGAGQGPPFELSRCAKITMGCCSIMLLAAVAVMLGFVFADLDDHV